MLQKNTVTTATLELLSRMMSDEFFSEFMLVGGTALALQLGHRKSLDLELPGTSISLVARAHL